MQVAILQSLLEIVNGSLNQRTSPQRGWNRLAGA